MAATMGKHLDCFIAFRFAFFSVFSFALFFILVSTKMPLPLASTTNVLASKVATDNFCVVPTRVPAGCRVASPEWQFPGDVWIDRLRAATGIRSRVPDSLTHIAKM